MGLLIMVPKSRSPHPTNRSAAASDSIGRSPMYRIFASPGPSAPKPIGCNNPELITSSDRFKVKVVKGPGFPRVTPIESLDKRTAFGDAEAVPS